MGIKGLYSFKYNNNYYICYQHTESSPNDLGNLILRAINDMIKNNDINEIIKYIQCIPVSDEPTIGDVYFSGNILDTIQYCSEVSYYTSNEEPECDVFIEYVYIVDFDKNKFIVKINDNRYYSFDLFNIPAECIDILNDEYNYIL